MTDKDRAAMGATMHVVSHTHWDREWYQDFQGFRVRLVYMMDELLDTLERDPFYRHFLLDGQTIMLDDYLEIRPENRERLAALIQAGRIAIGPWYVMPDEFLVSGESLIRNLLKGVRTARSWGVEPLKSGYVVDIFGHNSQMPQLLRGFGLDNAVLFRGFHGDGDPAEACWEGADGSRVLILKLDEDRAYGDFFFFMRWPFADRGFEYEREELLGRARAMLQYKRERVTTDVLLGLDGVDHVEIEPRLPWILQTLNDADLGVNFVHGSLEDFLIELRGKVNNLRTYRRELRSPGHRGLNNRLLANVLSSRVHLKQHNQHCETLLETWAEPWGVFTAWEGRPYSSSFLANAWSSLLQNHPHDSICGCSINQVHQDMIYRFDQARLVSEHMINEELAFIIHHLHPDVHEDGQAIVVFNPSQNSLDGVVEVEVALSAGSDAAITTTQLGGASFRLYDVLGQEVPYQLLSVCKNSLRSRRPYRSVPDAETVDRYLLAFQAQVPSFGYATYRLVPFKIEGPAPGAYTSDNLVPPARYPGSLRIRPDTWDNGRIRLSIGSDGTLTLLDHASGRTFDRLLSFEDDADIGEGWNHVAPLSNEVVTSLGTPAEVSVIHDGRFLMRLCIRTSLKIPAAIHPSETRRADERTEVPITTYLDLRKDDPLLRCRTLVTNTARDHRLRLLLATGLKTERFFTSTPFDVLERPVHHQGYADHLETAREVVPHNGLIALDDGRAGLAVYSRGLYECALRDDDTHTITLTLYRSTRKEVLKDDSDGGQLLGDLTFDYALRPYQPQGCAPNTLWLEHRQLVAGTRSLDRRPGRVVHATRQRRSPDLPSTKSFLSVESDSLVVTAVKRSEDHPERYIIRLFNVSERPGNGVLCFDRPLLAVTEVNLDEQPIRALQADGARLRVEARSKQILTLEVVC